MQNRTSAAAATATATADPPHANAISISLAATAGYVDTVGFVALFGFFSAHVTGNLVLIGSELAAPSHGVFIKLLAFPAFIAAVVVARLVVLVAQHLRRSAAPSLLLLQALLLVGFMSCGSLALPINDAQSGLALAAGALGAAAMGMQNAANRLVWPTLSPTASMTSNVIELVIDLVDMLRPGTHPDLSRRVRKFLWPVLSFGTGAILGAFAFQDFEFLALLPPITVIGWLALLIASSSSTPRPERPQESMRFRPEGGFVDRIGGRE